MLPADPRHPSSLPVTLKRMGTGRLAAPLSSATPPTRGAREKHLYCILFLFKHHLKQPLGGGVAATLGPPVRRRSPGPQPAREAVVVAAEGGSGPRHGG